MEANKVSKKKSVKQFISRIATWILGIIFGFLLLIEVTGMITKGSNYGVPNVFGYQIMTIATDSMKQVYPVDSAIIVQKFDTSKITGKGSVKLTKVDENDYVTSSKDATNYVDVSSPLQLGDDISFYWKKDGVPAPYIITHRVLAFDFNTDGTLKNLTCNGINKNVNNNTGIPQYPTPELILGKVVYCSSTLGWTVNALQSPITLIVLIVIPCSYVAISSILDIMKIKKEDKEEEENASTSFSDDLKEQMRQELIKEGKLPQDALSDISLKDQEKLKEEMRKEMEAQGLLEKKNDDPLAEFSEEDKERLKKELLNELLNGRKE